MSKKKVSDIPQAVAPFPDTNPSQADRLHAQRTSGRQAGGSKKGTPPSNTVPNNSNSGEVNEKEYFRLLRFGVDSLYLSYPGELSPACDDRLKELKRIAQSPEAGLQVRAQYLVEDHIFEVKDKGTGYFPYILEDNAFRIQFSRSRTLPFAYVKIASEYLSYVLPAQAERALRLVIEQFGTIAESANVSRIDLFADFTSPQNMESWDRHAWVTRASAINTYSTDRNFTGWTIGTGGVISCRLYDKTLEIENQSRKFYLHTLWKKTGWNGQDTVWRLEFQLQREMLVQKGLRKLSEVLDNLNGLWSYATTEWLRLTLPNQNDHTASRWPIHPLWGYLSSVDWQTHHNPLLSRFDTARIPGDKRLLAMALSAVISYMAREKIQDFQTGLTAFGNLLYQHCEQRGFELGLSPDSFIRERVAIKARKFNTILNDLTEAEKQQISDRNAAEYRKQSDGE